MNRIDQLLDCMDVPEIPVDALAPERVLRITEKTFTRVRSQTKKRTPRRAVRGLLAAVIAVSVLCTSAFAAQKLGLIDFTSIFGAKGATLDESAKVYEAYPGAQEDNVTEHMAKAENYNIKVQSTQASRTLLCVTVDCSRTAEDVPAFQESGLQLGLSGFDAIPMLSIDASDPRYVLCAPLDGALEAGTEVTVYLTDGKTQTELLRVPVEAAEVSAEAHFSDGTLTRAVCTQLGLYVEGRCDAGSEPAQSGTLDFSGFAITLYDKVQKRPDWDLQGYLVRCEIEDDGAFRLEWAFTKLSPFSFQTLHYEGADYALPDLTQEEAAEEISPSLGTFAQTQDYFFTLESVTADENAACAIVRVEPRTDYGAAHMGSDMPRWTAACQNLTAGTGSFGSALVEAGTDADRYLLWCTGDGTPFAEGDLLDVQILDILESGDTKTHSYSLFCEALGQVLPGSVCMDGGAYRIVLTPLTCRLEDACGGSADGREFPELSLSFRDGTVQALRPNATFGMPGLTRVSAGEADGSFIWNALLTAAIDPAEVTGVTIDGVWYPVSNPETN